MVSTDRPNNRFESHGPHPYVFIAVPFGLALLALATLAVVFGKCDAFTILGAVAIAAWGAWVLTSSAYSCWGAVAIARNGDRLAVTRALGSLSRRVEFAGSAIRSIEHYTPPPGIMMFPGSAGPQLRVYLQYRARPVTIGGGLCLDEQDLRSIEEQLCART